MSAAIKSPESASVSPMMAQYLALKQEAGDALLLFRMGDFYELFLGDAAIAAGALDIALTHRGQHAGEPLPMCGVPVHSHEAYLARLVKAGHRIAIAEQVEDPAEARKRGSKSVVARAIVRIVTPGTLTEERLLEGKCSNWLMAGFPSNDAVGLAWADISSGTFWMATVPQGSLLDELARIAPAELLWPDDAASPAAATGLASRCFDSRAGARALATRFGVSTPQGFGSFDRPALAAANALLTHLGNTGRGSPVRLDPPREHRSDGSMAIDAATRRSLEILTDTSGNRDGSLLAAVDRTVTAAGARLLADELAAPLTACADIEARLDLVQWFIGDMALRGQVRSQLRRAPDSARALGRIAAGRGSPRDLAALRDGLVAARGLQAALEAASLAGAPQALAPLRAGLVPPAALLARLEAALVETPPLQASDGGAIAEGFDPALDELRLLTRDTRAAIAALEAGLKADTGIASLKVRHNAVIGYHLEVPMRAADPLMADPRFFHRQTLAGVMRFDTEALRSLASRISQAQAHALAAEAAHLEELRAEAVAAQASISGVAASLAAIDRSAALAELAASEGWCRPRLTGGLDFAIVAGRHPVVEQARRKAGEPFVPNDCRLEAEARLWLVTGPNMGGKSTFLRQNALIAVLAQAGSYVPAAEARIGIVDRLFSRVGASDSLAEGRSTFMVEMVETAAILNGASARSLLLMDEVGRGTATWDGLALAWGIVEAIHDQLGARCLFATHYHELIALEARLEGLALRTMRVREWQGGLVFLHEVAEGAAPGSFGLQVARLAGVPAHVLGRAGEILAKLEAGDIARGARDALADLPLFSAAPVPPPPKDALRTRLAEIHPDTLSPRAALDLLYELKELGRSSS